MTVGQSAMLYVTCGLTIANFIILVRIWRRVSGEIEGSVTIGR